jgi:hypothetical protein
MATPAGDPCGRFKDLETLKRHYLDVAFMLSLYVVGSFRLLLAGLVFAGLLMSWGLQITAMRRTQFNATRCFPAIA